MQFSSVSVFFIVDPGMSWCVTVLNVESGSSSDGPELVLEVLLVL